jgi:undecaprenyl-diphosphatase
MGPLMHTVNDYRGGLYGFISSHAANSFGLAAIVSLIIPDRRLRIFIFIWATIVSYSRIYLGVHYPADVSVGAIVGLISARIVYLGYTKLYSIVKQKTQSKPLKNT